MTNVTYTGGPKEDYKSPNLFLDGLRVSVCKRLLNGSSPETPRLFIRYHYH